MAITKTAVAGRFQTEGDDFVHYVDKSGQMMLRVDSDGVIYPTDCITPDGISLRILQREIISGLPSDIDIGTF